MRIEFERWGGFVGLLLTYHASTDELPRKDAEKLSKLIENSGFFELQPGEVAPTSSGPPDVFSYRLSLSKGSSRKTLSFNDVTTPDSFRPLLEYLQKLALDQKRTGK